MRETMLYLPMRQHSELTNDVKVTLLYMLYEFCILSLSEISHRRHMSVIKIKLLSRLYPSVIAMKPRHSSGT